MDETTRQHEDLSRLYSQLKQSLPLLKERFLERLVVSGLRPAEIEERFRYFGLNPLLPLQLVMVADIDDFGARQLQAETGNDTEILRYAAYNVLEEIAEREHLLLFRTREERLVLVVSGNAEAAGLYEQAYRIAEEARFYIEKFLKFTVSIGVGQAVKTAEELPASYKSALSAWITVFCSAKTASSAFWTSKTGLPMKTISAAIGTASSLPPSKPAPWRRSGVH